MIITLTDIQPALEQISTEFDIKTTSNLEAGDELKSVYGILKVDKATKQKGLYRVKFFGWSFNLVRSSLLEANWIKK